MSTPTGPEELEIDADGFLIDWPGWNAGIGEALARREGIEMLTAEHWCVIGFLRSHYSEHRTLPVMRLACEHFGMEPHCVDRLFGADHRKVWRIAGLPNPGEEAKTYM